MLMVGISGLAAAQMDSAQMDAILMGAVVMDAAVMNANLTKNKAENSLKTLTNKKKITEHLPVLLLLTLPYTFL